jgi:acyl carrier protein
MARESIEQCVERLVREYAQSVPEGRPLDPRSSLRDDLGLESLSLLSLALRLGEELGVDVVEYGLELGQLGTVADLLSVASKLQEAGERRSV